MKRFNYLFLFLMMGLHTINAQNPSTKLPNSLTQKCDDYFQALAKLQQFNGNVLIYKDDGLILRKSYNLTDSIKTLNVHPESQFDLRSVAKFFAKVSIIKLENGEKLNRQDVLQKYIPDFPNGDKITLEHLLNHSSGLPREFTQKIDNQLDLNPEEMINSIKKEPLEFEIGADFRYSNLGYQLLYYIIGKVSGQGTFENYLQKNIFKPLKMKHSGGYFADNTNLENYAYGHYQNDAKQIKSVLAFETDEHRMGHLYSTIDDLQLFLNSLDNEPYLSEFKTKNNINHAGGADGKGAYISKSYDQNYTFIFLTNYENIPFEKTTQDIPKILQNQPYEFPKAIHRTEIQLAKETLKKYEGIYDFPELEHLQLKIILEDNYLVYYQKGKRNGVIYPETSTRFFWDKNSTESVDFETENDKIYLDFKGVKWEGNRIKK